MVRGLVRYYYYESAVFVMVHVWCSPALMIPVANCELGSVYVQSPAKASGATFSKEANFRATFCNQEYFREATFSNKGVKLSGEASPGIRSDLKERLILPTAVLGTKEELWLC